MNRYGCKLFDGLLDRRALGDEQWRRGIYIGIKNVKI